MASSAGEYAWLRNVVFSLSLLAWLLLLFVVPSASGADGTTGHFALSYCGAPLAAPEVVAYTPAGQRLPAVAPSYSEAPVLTWAWAGSWGIMLVAMMLPTLVPPLCHVHSRSFANRRARSIALFVAGYGVVWLVMGSGLLGLQLLAQWASSPYLPVAGAMLLAVVWQASPFKQRCLNRGHRHRALAAFGLRADWDALRLGLEHGGWCAASCWALMLVPLLLPHGHLLAMAAVGLLMFCERLDPPAQPAWRWRGFKTATGYGRLHLLRLRTSSASSLA